MIHRASLLSAVLAFTLSAALHAQIKVGEYASLTGKEAAFGQSSHQGTAMAIDEANAEGGVLGQKIELLTEDDQSKPGESVTAVKKLIARDKVVAVLGEVASGRSLEGASVCQAMHIPMISPFSTNPRVTEIGNDIFRVCFIDPFQGAVLAKFARDHLHANRVAVLTSASAAYSVGLSRYFTEAYKGLGGHIVATPKYEEGDRDFKAQLTAIKATKPDLLVVTGYYTEAALICRQARQLGLTVPVLGGDGCDAPELITIGGKDVDGMYITTHFSVDGGSELARDFVARFRKRYGADPDASAALGYESARVLIDAIRRAGTTQSAKLRDAIAATRDFPGVTGLITLDQHRNAQKPAVVLQVRGGRLRFVESITP